MTTAQLLNRIDTAWQAFVAAYDGLTRAEMMEPGVVGAWSVKDLIAHVSTWEREALTHLPGIMQGGRPPKYSVSHGGIDAFNARMTEANGKLPLDEVLRRRDATHRRLVAFVGAAPEDRLADVARVRRRLRLDTYGHYAIHAAAIMKWRAKRSDGHAVS